MNRRSLLLGGAAAIVAPPAARPIPTKATGGGLVTVIHASTRAWTYADNAAFSAWYEEAMAAHVSRVGIPADLLKGHP